MYSSPVPSTYQRNYLEVTTLDEIWNPSHMENRVTLIQHLPACQASKGSRAPAEIQSTGASPPSS